MDGTLYGELAPIYVDWWIPAVCQSLKVVIGLVLNY